MNTDSSITLNSMRVRLVPVASGVIYPPCVRVLCVRHILGGLVDRRASIKRRKLRDIKSEKK